jgi:hypothetical protein
MKPTLYNDKTGEKFAQISIKFLVGEIAIKTAIAHELDNGEEIKSKAQILETVKFLLKQYGVSGQRDDHFQNIRAEYAEQTETYFKKYFPDFVE